MKRAFLILAVVCMAVLVAHAQPVDRNFGLGFIVGGPTGFDAKYWTSDDNALDFAFGWWNNDSHVAPGDDVYHGTRYTHFHIDFLWHSWNAIHSKQRFPLFYGLGASAESAPGYTSTYFVRGLFGVAWMPRSAPIDIFIEVAPSVPVSRSGGLYFDGAFGAHWYF